VLRIVFTGSTVHSYGIDLYIIFESVTTAYLLIMPDICLSWSPNTYLHLV